MFQHQFATQFPVRVAVLRVLYTNSNASYECDVIAFTVCVKHAVPAGSDPIKQHNIGLLFSAQCYYQTCLMLLS